MTDQSLKESPIPVGFHLVLPPGWGKINLREESINDSILALVDRSINQLPDDIPKDDISKVRMELFKQLKKAARKAEKANGLLLYLPVERIRSTVVPASFVVSEPTDGTGAGIQSDQVLGSLAAGRGNSEPVEIDGSSGIRMERVVPPPEDSETDFASRRVEYVLSMPASPLPRWLAITFSTVGDGNPDSEFSSALVDLFDAVMMTFRWSYT
ncbi:hypothetical protein [Streptomyces sporangiiformans]|uniref:Uncharacterized protein n=1 Tax=Streptomyces sporangiiformans TaxID=2315329 RepID=A0A505DG86_9ACTN|nr:hypothetical protein [Streptomyces sporangiiformans]TPQ22077.1 hypothetical protein FGD71_011840 [Streptomyces sporangiiformans]